MNEEELSIFEKIYKGKCLIVDDLVFSQTFLTIFLNKHGYEVEVADSGEAAINIIKNKADQDIQFDIIWMDIIMEPMDGFKCSKIIKNTLGYMGKIIAFTSCDLDLELVKKCDNVGIDYIITKKMMDDDIFEYLENILKSAN